MFVPAKLKPPEQPDDGKRQDEVENSGSDEGFKRHKMSRVDNSSRTE